MAARGSTRLFLDAVEELFAELPSRARGGKEKLSEQATGVLRSITEELELVRKEDLEELELRVAQLEHRLRLLEEPRDVPPAA
jgi:polyhydroxyalkanoate synthesis regulator phasin